MLDFNNERSQEDALRETNAAVATTAKRRSLEDTMTAFAEEIRAAGLPAPREISGDGKLHRFDIKKRNDQAGWYVLYIDGGIPAGAFGSWQTGEKYNWSAKSKSEMSDVEREIFFRRIEAARATREAEQKQLHKRAQERANKVWQNAEPVTNHPYLTDKGVAPHGIKQAGNYLVIPFYDSAGAIHSLQWIDPEGGKKFEFGGKIDGHFHLIPGNDAEVFIAEGYATGATVHELTGSTVVVAFNAGNLMSVGKNARTLYPNAPITFAADNDQWKPEKGNPGVEYAKKAAAEIGARVVVPEFAAPDPEKRPTDFNDLARMEGAEVVKNQLDQKAVSQQAHLPDPVDIFGDTELSGSPDWPENALPAVIDDFARDKALRLGVEPQMIAIPAIAVAAAAANDGHKVQPKRHDDEWTERPCLWGAVIAEPGEKKSPAIKAAIKPLEYVEAEWHKENIELEKEHDRARIEYEKSTRHKGPTLEKPEKPAYRRKLVGDTTIEAVSGILIDNPSGILCYRDELTGWIGGHGAYKAKGAGAGDRSSWLESYNGGPHLVDRVKAGRRLVPNWSIGIVGGIQPGPARRVLSNITDDGLVQRFIIVFGRKTGAGEDRAPNYTAQNTYSDTIIRVAKLPPPESGIRFYFDNAAHEYRAMVDDVADGVAKLPSTSHAFKGHLSKWSGLFPRLALTFHIVKCVHENKLTVQISKETAEQTARLMLDFLLPNAARFYTEIVGGGDCDQISDARWIAGYILSRDLKMISVRDVYRSYRKLRDDRMGIARAMEHLVMAGWAEPLNANTRGLVNKWAINSKVHAIFAKRAERERQRREIQKAEIAAAAKKFGLTGGGE